MRSPGRRGGRSRMPRRVAASRTPTGRGPGCGEARAHTVNLCFIVWLLLV